MAAIVYILCTLSCLACAVLLLRGYRYSQLELLFWSSVCFFILAVANLLLIVDLVIYRNVVDLSVLRSAITLVAIVVLLYGLIFKSHKS